MKRTMAVACILVLGLLTGVRGESQQAGVHSITLPNMPPELPEGAGREAVMTRCVLCHSPRYITMQPAFSRTVWTNEVTKMRKVFGAPIAEEQVEELVNYLVAVRGK